MVFDPFAGIPLWIYQGLLVGVLSSVCVAATFVLAARVFPDGNETRDTWGSTEDRRRAEIRRYLDAIGERYTEDATVIGEHTEDATVDGEHVAFYLPQRDVAVTFDPRTFLALEDSSTYGILAEHELPGVALGSRLPFETPEISVGGAAGADRDSRASERERYRRLGRGVGQGRPPERERERAAAAFAVLGLPDSADAATVRRAYRDRVKEVHPDQGGDEDEFQKIRAAYDTARRHAS